jgi:bifunctional non-homologous end joining protein LigD
MPKAVQAKTKARGTGPSRRDSLKDYQAKRDFDVTSEPRAKRAKAKGDRFVVQKHDARRLHYDLRLEMDGVLKSWAVTRGPSLVPGEKRLAVHTEDHPLEYIDFEGVIPEGQYGGGTMIVWDQGRWTPEGDAHADYARGRLTFTLEGERLKGRWHLVRTRMKPGTKKEQWLLLKSEDEEARTADEPDILEGNTTSLLTGRTNQELASAGDTRVDHARREKVAAERPAKAATAPRKVAGAKKGILPGFVDPSLAKLVEHAPSGENWIHEIKFDGYRLQARIDGDKITLLTRKGLDWTKKFQPIADALAKLKLPSALLDGEVVVEDKGGVSHFSALQQALTDKDTGKFVYYAFDLLYLDGKDFRPVKLTERKAALRLLLEDLPEDSPLRFSDHIAEKGDVLIRHACRMGLEGIVSKRADQDYRSGRGDHWVKSKCTLRQELVISGYVPSSTGTKAIGSLAMGLYEKGKFVHVGRVGTGYTPGVARKLYETLSAQSRTTSPFDAPLTADAKRGVRWVEPTLVAEVEFAGWTADGILRHASFLGLRDDKEPKDVVRESRPVPQEESVANTDILANAHLTHPDRVLWEDVGTTKLGLAEFYSSIADHILPHVIGRPLSLLRCPSGAGDECFFQKHAWAGLDADLIERVKVGEDEALAIRDLAGLLALVQASVLEIHPWGSTLQNPEKPDHLIFDLDPGEGVGWAEVVQGAIEVRDYLAKDCKLTSFVKTSGGKGLHVIVPVQPKASWDEAKAFASGVASALSAAHPDRYTDTMAKKVRVGRIFIDYLRNGRGATAVAAFSTRARPGAPVSAPIAWNELKTLRSADQFRMGNLAARLKSLNEDPWAGYDAVKQVLPVMAKPAKPKRSRKSDSESR